MEQGMNMRMKVAVTFKGSNYLVWSRMVKTAVGSKGLWGHITTGEAPKLITQGGDQEEVSNEAAVEKWQQEDMLVMTVLHASLDPAILDAYSYCESAKELWDTLKKVYGNISNLSRVFEVKLAINRLAQEDMEFTKHLGRFRSLWSELEMLRPSTTDPDQLNERREQDKVFGLLLTLNPAYTQLIQHMLRSDKLPDLEEVCAQIQREQGSMGLFGGKGELSLANQAAHEDSTEAPQANKASHGKYEDRKFNGNCDHCKKHGHKKSQCWILHPHLKPAKFMKEREGRANVTEGSSGAGTSKISEVDGLGGNDGNGKSLVAYTGASSSRSNDDYIKRSDLDALVKMLKENGNTYGYSFGASMIAYKDDHLIRELVERLEARNGYRHAHIARTDKMHPSLSNLCHNAKRVSKPLIVDSGASHHMISDENLIKDIEPTHGHVMIANGDKIPIRGIGKLKLFNKESRAFYMPEFTSNLLSVKKCTNDLQCNVIFSPNDVKFQDIESSRLIGKGVTKGDLYMLEELTSVPDYSCSFTSASLLNKNALWHARVGHPHVKALNLMVPGVVFENKDCEACILGKHCRTVFQKSTTVYDNCFDLIHSDVWTAPCLSRDSYKYFVTFIDEKSKYTWLTLIQTKDRVLDAFRNFQTYVTNHYHAKIKILRSDNGGEYTSHAFKQHLSQHGILHQTSCPYTPQQNGVAERKNRHLMEVARSLMFQSNVPKRFWSDAVATACYLINRTPTKVLNEKAPFEVLNRYKPALDYLRVFGCLCFVLKPGEMINKLEARSTKAVFIGYSATQKGYKCYDPIARRVLVSRDVKFLEDRGYYEEKNQEDLKDLTSDKATTLRIILEGLGISTSQDPRNHATTPPEVGSPSHLDHEGGEEHEEPMQEANQDEGGVENEGEESIGSDGHGHDHGVTQTPSQDEVVEEQQEEVLRREPYGMKRRP
ncbi:hypothetical protein YC2023_108750 [Brassica napus]